MVSFRSWRGCTACTITRMALPERPARCLVLLAAIPGAGKSVIASMIEQFSLLLKGMPAVQSIGMDGWHLPNRVIRSRKTTNEAGWIVPLSTRKGSPESFDIKRLMSDLRVARFGCVRSYAARLRPGFARACAGRGPGWYPDRVARGQLPVAEGARMGGSEGVGMRRRLAGCASRSRSPINTGPPRRRWPIAARGGR